MNPRYYKAILCALILTLSACATVDFDAPKAKSLALTDTGGTRLGKYFFKHADRTPLTSSA